MNDTMPTVLLEREIPASPRDVFEAWLEPEAIKRFMFPAEGGSIPEARCEAKVGGQFFILMRVGDRDIPHQGEYLEIQRYTRLAFTWRSVHAGEGSRVVLTFVERPGGKTHLTLEHFGLPDEKARTGHKNGWTLILDSLIAWKGQPA